MVLTFDETVDFSTFTSSAITITDSAGANGQALSGTPTEGVDGTTMTIPITLAEKEIIAAHTGVREIDAGITSWDDVAANANLAVTDDPIDTENEDTTAPLIATSTLNLQIGTGTLVLTFDETVDFSTFTSSAITITDSAGANGVALSAAPTEAADGTTMTIALTSTQREAIAAHTALPREIDAGITAWDDVAANANLAVTDDPIDSETEDTAGPLIQTSTLNLQIGTGTLVLTFDETVDFSTFTSSAITITDSAGANGVALSAAPTEAADGTTMTIALTSTQREAIAAHTALPREIDATTSAWDDLAGTPNANAAVTDDPIDSETEDTAGPLIATSTLNLQIGTGTLVLTFDETVDFSTFDSSAITITDSAGANGVALSAAPTEAADGTTMTIAFTSTQREAIAAHTALPREIDATTSAWDDLAGTPNANAAVTDDPIDSETEDTAGPLIQTSTLNLDGDSPTLVLTFDETVDFSTFDSSAITITDSAGANGQALSGTPTEGVDGTTMTIPITLAEKEIIAAHTGVREIDAGITAWDDLAGTPNANAAVTDDPIDTENEDTAGPLIATSTLNLQIGTGTLVLTFDETVDFSTFDSSAITITDSAGANGVALSAAPTEAADGTTMTIALTSTQREAIAAHTALPREIDATTSAWDDLGANANLAVTDDPIDSETEDTAGPLIQTSTLNLDGDSPTLVLTFDETVDFSTFTSSAITITDSAGANGQALSGTPTEGVDGTTMTIPITLAEKEIIAAHTGVREIDAGITAWDDLAGTPNANAAVTDDPIDTENEDTTAPLIATSTLNLDGDSPTLVLTFDEAVDESAFDPTAITITDSAGANAVVLTAASPNESVDGTTMTIPITLAEKESIAAHAALPREIDATTSAWDDVAANANLAVTDDPIDTENEDTTAPLIATSTLNLQIGTGTLVLTFDETVDFSTFDSSAITITDSAGANGVALSAAPTEAADGTTMTIALTSTPKRSHCSSHCPS